MLVHVFIDPFLFVEQLRGQATYEDILEIIIAMDEEQADWAFTEMVYEHFRKQHELYLEEMD
jgi:hypothetical protein